MVGPGALKPTVGDGIESRRPLHHQFYFLSFFFVLYICICIGVFIMVEVVPEESTGWVDVENTGNIPPLTLTHIHSCDT